MRGFAALSVFGFHIWLYGAKDSSPRIVADVFNELRIGLICFFVLSGYLLYGAFVRAARRQAGEVSLPRYFARRAARILPAYYVSLIGALALLGPVAGSGGVRMPDEGGLTLFVFFAQNYSADTIMKLNPVTWTLCLEVAFYALLPVLGLFAYHLAKGRRGPQVALLGGLIALGVGWNVAAHLLDWQQPAVKALPAYLPYFAVGMLVSLGLESRREDGRALRLSVSRTWLVSAAGLALVAGNAWWHIASPGPARDPILMALHDLPAGLGFALLICAVAAGRGAATAWLRTRWLAGLGVISYGFYLWHVPLILFVKETSSREPGAFVLAAVVTPLALAAGAASWRWIERPMLNAVSGRLAARARARA
ncbi:MAG TPA: acyltransferase [Solirubrobacteraceae bacterium]|nr:acyltransferase [Solirubrobacteraceae bacterium]